MGEKYMPSEAGDITRLLGELVKGDRTIQQQLLQLVHGELHRMARRYMRAERADHTLQPTALVNEVYLRLVAQGMPSLSNRSHFFALAAQAMRRILVDYARATRSQKRGGDLQQVDLDGVTMFTEEDAEEMIALDRALSRLEKLDQRQSRIVELRFFMGLPEEEVAEALEISVRTVKRDWRIAKAWLHAELTSSTA